MGDTISAQTAAIPLVVDLDGTLTPSDTLHETAVRYALSRPVEALINIPRWLTHGRAWLKQQLAVAAPLNVAALPYATSVTDQIEQARAAGSEIVLSTASDITVAQRISDHLGIFDRVMASDGEVNLAGENKANALIEVYGAGGFDYIGNSSADLPVWAKARNAYVVSSDASLIKRAEEVGNVAATLPAPTATMRDWVKQLRLHQWVKNALVFVPLIAAQRLDEVNLYLTLIMAFVALGVIASSTYVLNDLFDLEADRLHKSKRFRPLASGKISTLLAVLVVPSGLALGLLLAALVSWGFFGVTLVYILVTLVYSFALKRAVLIDCICLAGLFTLRIVAGAVAISNPLSHWLLLFSLFLFLSLAYLKRCIELKDATDGGKIAGRGYHAGDLPLITSLGIGASYAALIVLSLYLFSDAASALYQSPYTIVIAVPVFGYWISYMWLVALRGEMHHDPVLHALKDKTSIATIVLFFLVFFIGAQLNV